MSLTEILEKLRTLSPGERQQIVDRIDEIDEVAVPPEVKAMIEHRWSEHLANPSKALTVQEFNETVDRLVK